MNPSAFFLSDRLERLRQKTLSTPAHLRRIKPGSSDWISILIIKASSRSAKSFGAAFAYLASFGVQFAAENQRVGLIDLNRSRMWRIEELLPAARSNLDYVLQDAGFRAVGNDWPEIELRLLLLMQSWALATAGGTLFDEVGTGRQFRDWLALLDETVVAELVDLAATISSAECEMRESTRVAVLMRLLDQTCREKVSA